jgi:hypothetical protein
VTLVMAQNVIDPTLHLIWPSQRHNPQFASVSGESGPSQIFRV